VANSQVWAEAQKAAADARAAEREAARLRRRAADRARAAAWHEARRSEKDVFYRADQDAASA
jgi:hypothetical protein